MQLFFRAIGHSNAKAHTSRASRALRRAAPSGVLPADPMINMTQRALEKLDATVGTLSAIRCGILSMMELATAAHNQDDLAERAMAAESYMDLRTELEHLLDNARSTLIGSEASAIHVPMPGNASYVISAVKVDANDAPFTIPVPHGVFSENDECAAIVANLERVLSILDRMRKTYQGDIRLLKRRHQEA